MHYRKSLLNQQVFQEENKPNTKQIRWATSNSIPFIAQSGAHGFSTSLSQINHTSIVINLRALNSVTVSLSTGTAQISAGALTGEVLHAAHAAHAHIMTGVCTTVGVIPALLGGGLGTQISLYGLGVDNILSARLCTADGAVLTVSKDQHADLFWGLRGAGHHFGIVSQLTVKAHPEINNGVHWTGTLIFPGAEDTVENITETLRHMGVAKGMGCVIIFA